MGYSWVVACIQNGDDDPIALVREKPPGNVGTDKVLSKTAFKDVLSVAQRFPLPVPQPPAVRLEPVQYVPAATADTPLDRQGIPVQLPVPDEDELLLDQPAAPPKADAKGSPSVSEPPSPSSQAAVPSEISNTGTSKPASPVPAPTAPQSPPGPVSPLPPPKLPDPPIPSGQQASAVDAARKSEDWSANAKAMWKSRRFWGLVLVMGGRLWMLKTGSNAVLGAVSDPLVTEMFSGFMVMLIGEVVQHWGERKATRPLR